jgi:alkylated DNA repair dioxygenase AlkB
MPPRNKSSAPRAVQSDLFGPAGALPDGFRYEEDFLTADEEAALLAAIRSLPLEHAKYKEYSARRRVASFGGRFDYSNNELLPADRMPEWLLPLRARAAEWARLRGDQINHALVAEYAPGTPLGWHRDVPDFEAVIGVSLAGWCRFRFRRYPPGKPARAEITFDVAPRSIYTLQGESRWRWQHSVSPTTELRYSITFRTLRGAERRAASDLRAQTTEADMDQQERDVKALENPAPGEDPEQEHERVRSSNDLDQELERQGEQSRHNRGYDEAVRGRGDAGSVADIDRIDRDDE